MEAMYGTQKRQKTCSETGRDLGCITGKAPLWRTTVHLRRIAEHMANN